MDYKYSNGICRTRAWLLSFVACIAPGMAFATVGAPFHKTGFDAASELAAWNASAGNWQITSGALVNSSTGASNIIAVDSYDPFDVPVMESNFQIDVYVWMRSGASNARAGVVFNFSDPNNYHEVTITPLGNLRQRSVIGGVVRDWLTGTFPAPGTNRWVHLTVKRAGERITAKVDGVPILVGVTQANLPDGDVGLITHNMRAHFDDFGVLSYGLLFDPYLEGFEHGDAIGWSQVSPSVGGWSASGGGPGGNLESTAIGPADIILTPLAELFNWGMSPNPRVFTIKTLMTNRYSASGNQVGYILFRDPRNYEEIVFNPLGQARLNRIVNGVRTTVATARYVGGGDPSRSFEVELAYRGNQGGPSASYVRVNGLTVFENLPLDFESGEIGLVTHWARARFDDVRAAPRFFQPMTADFADGEFPNEFFSPIDTWSVQDGALNSFGIGKNDTGGFQVWRDITNVRYDGVVTNRYDGSGNRAGFVYGYLGPDDYYEVVLNPTGTAFMNRVLKGVTTNLATAPYPGAAELPTSALTLIYANQRTTLLVEGATVFFQVYQPDAARGFMGVVTHWTNAAFGNLEIRERR